MALTDDHIDRLEKALDRNTAALLTVAVQVLELSPLTEVHDQEHLAKVIRQTFDQLEIALLPPI